MIFNTYAPVRGMTSLAPELDYEVVRSEDGVVVSIDIPGIDPATVNLTVEGRSLRVEASRRSSIPEGAKVLSRRRHDGSISQGFELGERLDSDQLTADYNFGVLTVTIPVAESSKPRRVDVSVGALPVIDAPSEAA